MSHVSEFQGKCDKVIGLLENDLTTVKTGRAKPDMVENLKVEAYGGSWMEVRELAGISAPDAHSLVISPWDKSVIKDLEKGLAKAEGNLNPIVSGDIIRIVIPALTEERRKEYVKLVHQKNESHKAMVRQERTHFKKLIEGEKNVGGVSEDDVKNNLEELQDVTDKTIAKLDELSKNKEIELMKV